MTLIKCISRDTAKIQNGTIIYSAGEIGCIATGVTNPAAPSEDGGDMTIQFNYTVGLLKEQKRVREVRDTNSPKNYQNA